MSTFVDVEQNAQNYSSCDQQDALHQWYLNTFKKQAYRFPWTSFQIASEKSLQVSEAGNLIEGNSQVPSLLSLLNDIYQLENPENFPSITFLNGQLISSSETIKEFIKETSSEVTFIRIPKDTHIEHPIYIFHISSHPESSPYFQSKLELEIGEGVSLSLVESYLILGSNACIQKSITNITLNEESTLNHVFYGKSSVQAILHSSTYIEQKGNSHYSGYLFSKGFTLQKNQLTISLSASNATAKINAIASPKENEYQQFDLTVNHLASNCQSQSIIRGVAKDRARFDFIGKITVDEAANNTVARLENKNLLLSKEAHIETSPELEVYNDDVQCSHGATVGSLDEQALFYLQSRGISKEEAKQLLIQAFLAPILSSLPNIAKFNFTELPIPSPVAQ